MEQPTGDREAVARVSEVLGSATDPGIEIEIALRKHALPFEFSKDAERQAKRLPADVRPADRKGRIDLTALPLVTIDGETAKDFDDAVYCERKGRNYRLIVAIADVSHYVRDGDAIDKDARERGTSVYFPRRVIPMLPEELSNELCSLKGNVDRLCMACDMEISLSWRRQGLQVLSGRDALAGAAHLHAGVAVAVRPGHRDRRRRSRCSRTCRTSTSSTTSSRRRAPSAAPSTSTRPSSPSSSTTHGKITRIVPAPRNEAHKLIEECMLAANVCAADFLTQKKQMTLFRVHEPPPPDKLALLREFLAMSALHLGGGERPTAADYAKLLDAARDAHRLRPPADGAAALALAGAVPSRQRGPLRPRLRGLRAFHLAHPPLSRPGSCIAASRRRSKARPIRPRGMTWQQLGVHTSMTERRADEAARDVVNWLKCHYMQDHIGEEFDGTVSGVTSFGLFVTLDGLAIDGLVHITELGRDYFHFDAVRHALAGEHTGVTYQLAARVRVKVARVDMEQSKIDFVLADAASADAGPAARRHASRGQAAGVCGAAVARESPRHLEGAGERQVVAALGCACGAPTSAAARCAGTAWATSSRRDTSASPRRC